MLSVEGLSARYNSRPIFDRLSLDIQQNETILLTGSNGCGKTTFLKACLGLLPHTTGRILFKGVNLLGLRTIDIVRMGVGYAPQHQGLFQGMTVEENLLLALSNYLNPRACIETIEIVLESFPALKPILYRNACLLSGGEQKLVTLATALICEPRVLLIDEPLMGLSAKAADEVLEKLEELSGNNVSMLIVEHDISAVSKICNRVVKMDRGSTGLHGLSIELQENRS